MPQLLSMLQPFAIALLLLGMFAIVYFLGRIKPVGEFFATLIHIPGIALRSLAQFLKPFSVQEKPQTSRYTGLRTIVLNVAAVFAIVATGADWFLTNQALVAITDDPSMVFTLPANLSWLNMSQGFLLLSIPSIAGMILLDNYFRVVPAEARIFDVPSDQEAKERFEKFIKWTFILSLVASIAYNALKPFYMLDTESITTLVLRIIVFVVLGGMLPLCMALTVYIISAALHSLISLGLTIAWFLALTGYRILGFLANRFAPDEKVVEITTIGFYETDTVVVREVGKSVSSNGNVPGIDTLATQNLLPGQSQTALPDASLNGHTAANSEQEQFSQSVDTTAQSVSVKPEKNGYRRRIGIFNEKVPITPDPANDDEKSGKTSSTRKVKTPVKRVVRNKTTKTQARTKAVSNAAK